MKKPDPLTGPGLNITGPDCNRPDPFRTEIATLDTLDEVIADLEGFTQGHLNSTLVMEANGWRLINRARELRQARRAA